MKEISPKPRVTKPVKIILFAVAILIILGFFLKSWFVVAVVNNYPITRLYLDRELEKQGGKQVLEGRISEILILQEARKEKVTVTQDEINQKIAKIEEQLKPQGQTLDAVLAMQGQTRIDLEKQLQLQVLIEKMVGKDVSVSDQEIKDYFDQNAATYPKGTKLEDKKDEIKNTLFNQALGTKFQPWLDNLRQQAKIYSFLSL